VIVARCFWISGALALLVIAPAACRDRGGSGSAPAATVVAGDGTARPPPLPPAGAEELALVSPLAKGSELGGWEVRDIHGVQDGVMRLVCVKAQATVRLDVALAADDGPEPPATAGKYAVYYSLKGAFPEEGLALAQKLAKVLEPHKDAPAPPGMTKFVPKEKKGTTL
jgi:hypothetical protein